VGWTASRRSRGIEKDGGAGLKALGAHGAVVATGAPVLLLAFPDGARDALSSRLDRVGVACDAVDPTWAKVQDAVAEREKPPRVIVVDMSVRPSHARACVGALKRRAAWKPVRVVFARAPKDSGERAKALSEAPDAVFAEGDDELVRLVKAQLKS
jgi:hypothetical protein